MAIVLDSLPYSYDALEPHISKETLEFHHDKHHAGYVANTNNLSKGTEFEDKKLEFIIKNATGPLFNNAAQTFNHSFYWQCLTPTPKTPSDKLAQQIEADFGSIEDFKKEFLHNATTLFGSGWTWLVLDNGKLEILNTQNAQTPITSGKKPLLVCDVWEHAYYIDYRNKRVDYLDGFWKLVNWNFVSNEFSR